MMLVSHWNEIRQDKHNHQQAREYNKVKTYPTYEGLKHNPSVKFWNMFLNVKTGLIFVLSYVLHVSNNSSL